MKGKGNARKIYASAAMVVVSAVLLIGLTFAWFTDSVTNKGNKIQAGTLGITATVAGVDQNATQKYTIEGVNGGQAFGFSADAKSLEAEGVHVISEANWEPGQSNAKLLTVTNDGNLAAKVKLQFDVQDSGLQNALWFDFVMVKDGQVQGAFQKRPMSQLATIAEGLELPVAAGGSVEFILVYGMDETAGNEYQGKSFTADATVLATQDTVEKDGFGNNQYDKGATYPVSTVEEAQDALKNAQDGDVIQLTGDMKLTKALSIDKDITLDGNGKTIISEQPVYVGSTNDVVVKNVTFTEPKNNNNNASSLYASGLEGDLTLEGCRFLDFQWEGVQITPKAGANIVVDNCYFGNSKTMQESGITTNRYFHVEVTDGATDIGQIHLTLTNNTFNNVTQSDAGGVGYFKDSAVTSYGVPKSNIVCSGNLFTGNVQDDALANSSIIWMSDGRSSTLMYEGFTIKR